MNENCVKCGVIPHGRTEYLVWWDSVTKKVWIQDKQGIRSDIGGIADDEILAVQCAKDILNRGDVSRNS